MTPISLYCSYDTSMRVEIMGVALVGHCACTTFNHHRWEGPGALKGWKDLQQVLWKRMPHSVFYLAFHWTMCGVSAFIGLYALSFCVFRGGFIFSRRRVIRLTFWSFGEQWLLSALLCTLTPPLRQPSAGLQTHSRPSDFHVRGEILPDIRHGKHAPTAWRVKGHSFTTLGR